MPLPGDLMKHDTSICCEDVLKAEEFRTIFAKWLALLLAQMNAKDQHDRSASSGSRFLAAGSVRLG
jgi:hypothetical protein